MTTPTPAYLFLGEYRGRPGRDGSNVLPTDTAIAQEVQDPDSATTRELVKKYGPLKELGTWDASTNTPTLTDGDAIGSAYYVVSVGGVCNFGSGAITFNAGDFVRYDGEVWTKTINDLWPTNPVDAAEPDMHTVRGIIDTAGFGSIVAGVGFSVARPAEGIVTVTFDVPFSAVPTVIATATSQDEDLGATGPNPLHRGDFTRTTTAFQIELQATGVGLVDGVFDFVAIGPQ